MTTQFDPNDPTRFEEMYRDERIEHGLPAATPWDIGGPQPVVQQLVALGAIKGDVLDPGTGPGHHAIYYASKGYSATGVDGSEGALERARENARKAGGTGGPFRPGRRLRLLPPLQPRPRSAEVVCAGAAPGHQAGCPPVHVR